MKKLIQSIIILMTVLYFFAPFQLNGEVGNAALLWSKNCQKCHGKDGRGKTKTGKMTKVKDFTDCEYQDSLKEEEMHKNVKESMKVDGKTKMKPFAEKLTDEEIAALIAFVRKFRQ